MRKRETYICVVLMMALVANCAGPRTAGTGVIAVVVLDDSTGEILPNAVVHLSRSDASEGIQEWDRSTWESAYTASTGEDARFAWNPVPPGHYLVRATRLGYLQSQIVKVHVAAADTSKLVFRMNPNRDSFIWERR